MSVYCSRVALKHNGEEITDFKSFTENAQTHRRVVELMNKTGVSRVKARHGFKLEYVHPEEGEAPKDFSIIENATFTAVREDGKRIQYLGVSCLETGEAKTDGENDKVSEIMFMATGKTIT